MIAAQLKAEYRTRPPDARFATLPDLSAHARQERERSFRAPLDLSRSTLEAREGGLLLRSPKGNEAVMSEFSFGQLCGHVGAPAGFLKRLDPSTAAEAMNQTLRDLPAEMPLSAMLRRGEGDGLVLSGLNGPRYTTIWNSDCIDMIAQAEGAGWKLAHQKAAYYSDHNFFAFFMEPKPKLDDGKSPLHRGFILSNSEVGDRSLSLTAFLFRSACANLCIFGVEGVENIRIRHVGDADVRAFGRIAAELDRYRNADIGPTMELITKAKAKELGDDEDKIIKLLANRGIASQKLLERAWLEAEKHEATDGGPHTVWGLYNGLTRITQGTAFGDEQIERDTDAGRILALAA
jgi:hypothetical protein